MDFFEYANLVDMFVTFSSRWITYLVGGLCYLIVFIFSAMALWTISKREGYKQRWMSLVPILNTYYIGVCGQKNRMFKMNTKIVAIVAASVELCCVVMNILYYTAFETLISGGYIVENTVDSYYWYTIYTDLIPSSLSWAGWIVNNSETYIMWWLEIIYLLLDIAILYCFFQTYAARRYFIFTLTSILFPIQGIIFYTVRNNKGMNYGEFMKKQQDQQYQMYQQYNRQNPSGQNNPYDDPYNQNPYSRNRGRGGGQGGDEPPAGDDPYDLGGSGSGSSGDDDPFSEFGGGDDDPFS